MPAFDTYTSTCCASVASLAASTSAMHLIYSHNLLTKITFLPFCFRAPGKDTRCSYGFYRPHLPYCGYFVLLYCGIPSETLRLVSFIVFTSTNLHVPPLDHSLIHTSSNHPACAGYSCSVPLFRARTAYECSSYMNVLDCLSYCNDRPGNG